MIPARGGSKGVKNKNIALVGGYPLIAYSIMASQKTRQTQLTFVSTDSEVISEKAQRWGAYVPFLRPKEISGDSSTDLEWVLNALEYFKDYDLIVHLRPTTPLRDPKIIEKAIALFMQCEEATSLRSAHKLEESPYKMFVKDEEYFKSFMHGEGEFYNRPRQDFQQVYVPNGYVDILRVDHILKNHNLHGDKILAFETPKVVEVDTEENLLELGYHCKNNPIFQYLEKNFWHLRET